MDRDAAPTIRDRLSHYRGFDDPGVPPCSFAAAFALDCERSDPTRSIGFVKCATHGDEVRAQYRACSVRL